MKYKHIFFDLDHTLWDFDTNSRQALEELYKIYRLEEKGINDFDLFQKNYLVHNEILWSRYRNGFIKVEDLRWKRMWLTLIDFRVADEELARELGAKFLEILPYRKTLFPYAEDILQYLTDKHYQLHMITNGFEITQHNKLKHCGLHRFFIQVITSEGSNSIKPNKEIFEYAFMKTQAQSHECIMIGDSIEADIQGGINAGIDQVYMNHLNIAPAVQPTYTVYSLKELEKIF